MAISNKVQSLLGEIRPLFCSLAWFSILILSGLGFGPAAADVLVHLKDGRTITVPVSPNEVKSIEFVQGQKHIKAPPPALPAGPQTLKVGPGLFFALPSEAAKAARDGDTVEIAAAIYEGDVATWRQSNLTVRGVGGRPHLKAAGRSAGGKAIWVMRGDNVRIENIEFSGAMVGDHNGAAIRGEGNGLTLDHVIIHDNEMGIMVGSYPNSDIVITHSEFYDNYVRGRRQPIGHNVYIGSVRSLTLSQSKIHGARIGHNVKSRAAKNIITGNKIYDGDDGSASYQIDLSDAGVAVIEDNQIEQGKNPENIGLISYGAERLRYSENRLLIAGNTFRNLFRSATYVQNHTNFEVEIKNNTFSGPGEILRGKGIIDGK